MVRESAKEGFIDNEDSTLLAGALAFGATTVEAVMVPIDQVDAVSVATTVAATEARLVESQHTRLVVFESSINDVVSSRARSSARLSNAAKREMCVYVCIRVR